MCIFQWVPGWLEIVIGHQGGTKIEFSQIIMWLDKRNKIEKKTVYIISGF